MKKEKSGSVAAETPTEVKSQVDSTTPETENQVLLGKDAVAIIKTAYPGFDHSLWSKCKRPDIYGVTLTAGAKKLVASQKPRRSEHRTKEYRWAVRFTKTTHKRLQTAMESRGIKSRQTFIEAIVLKWLEENGHVG
jgi:hypothetical protein